MDKNTAKKLALGAFMSIALLILSLSVDWRGTYSVIRKGDLYFIVAALIITLTRFLVWTVKWQRNISPLAELSFSKTFTILMTGVFLNQITPGRDTGGEPVRAYYVSKFTGIKKRDAFATIVVDKSGNYIALGFFIAYSILFLSLFLDIPYSLKIVLESIPLFFLVIIVSGVYIKKNHSTSSILTSLLRRIYFFAPLNKIRDRFSTYAKFEGYVTERIIDFTTTFRGLVNERKKVRDNLLLSFFIWALVFIKTYLIFLAFGKEVSIFMVVAVEAASIFLGVLSFLPGGVGATEVTMIALFRSAGVGLETATAVTIVSRGIFYAFTMLLGYAAFLYLKLSPEKRKPTKDEVEFSRVRKNP